MIILNLFFKLDKDCEEVFGKFTVRTLSETSSQDYTLREFSVKKEGSHEERNIFHFQFLVMKFTLRYKTGSTLKYYFLL